MLKLSPLNFQGLIATANGVRATDKPRKKEAIECWRCPVCRDVYSDEDEATQCCQDEDEDEDEAECPICTILADSTHEAASCCLWKDFDMATRHRIADAVEAGSTWLEAIEAESKKH